MEGQGLGQMFIRFEPISNDLFDEFQFGLIDFLSSSLFQVHLFNFKSFQGSRLRSQPLANIVCNYCHSDLSMFRLFLFNLCFITFD